MTHSSSSNWFVIVFQLLGTQEEHKKSRGVKAQNPQMLGCGLQPQSNMSAGQVPPQMSTFHICAEIEPCVACSLKQKFLPQTGFKLTNHNVQPATTSDTEFRMLS